MTFKADYKAILKIADVTYDALSNAEVSPQGHTNQIQLAGFYKEYVDYFLEQNAEENEIKQFKKNLESIKEEICQKKGKIIPSKKDFYSLRQSFFIFKELFGLKENKMLFKEDKMSLFKSSRTYLFQPAKMSEPPILTSQGIRDLIDEVQLSLGLSHDDFVEMCSASYITAPAIEKVDKDLDLMKSIIANARECVGYIQDEEILARLYTLFGYTAVSIEYFKEENQQAKLYDKSFLLNQTRYALTHYQRLVMHNSPTT